jgi:signal transduction histidine kinase
MSPRVRGRSRPRAARAAAAPPADDARALDELRRKYAALCAKYEALVARASTDVSERVGTVALAVSAMRARPSALALADAERVLFANERWTELARTRAALVRLSGDDVLPARAAARQIAEAGTSAILAARSDAIAGRYELERGGRAWDFRFERTSYRGLPVAVVVANDATAALRGERELEAARRRIAEQERLRTIGLLAAGVAHDFANALNGAGLHLGLLAADAGLGEPARRHVASLQRIVAAMVERTRRLRGLALRRQELAIERVELWSVAAAAADLARAEFRSSGRPRVDIEVDPAVERLPPVRGAGAELVHLVLNLLLNARDAMSSGGTVRIRGSVDAESVCLQVADQGPGIPHEHLARVFEPFFTTKGEGGTGLGLATAYGLMHALDGEITAANRRSGGAVFSLRFRRWT